ncbi:MAG: hypothetical protein WB791_01500 [Waddliaceae bacterium]
MLIELSPTAAIMVYLCLTLATLLGIWGFHHWRSRQKKVLFIERKLYVCEYCQFVYLDQIAKSVTQCPQCQSFNKREFDVRN